MPQTKKQAVKVSASKQAISKSIMPVDIKPMLATLVDDPFDEDGWLYEIKWDGYRAISYVENGSVQIRSRNNKSFNEKFYTIYNALSVWPVNAVLDGEIMVVNKKGIADFSSLQTWRSEADGELVYYLFDILWLNGESLMDKPLTERRNILRNIAPADSSIIKVSQNFEASATDFFAMAKKMNLEGIIAKRADSTYHPGSRSKDWLKIKTEQRQEAIIAGYTKNENTSKLFSALLMGVYNKGVLQYIGPVGTGFSNKLQEELIKKLQPLITKQCPFAIVPEYNKPSRFRPDPPKAEVTWVKPLVVAEISFRAETADGAMRHPSFKGLREDKPAREVVRETALPVSAVKEEKILNDKKVLTPASKKERRTLLNPTEETQVKNIEGHDLKFTNLSKLYWPADNITKRDMINYYYQVAPYILPYLKDRPLTLNRHPNGIDGPAFYQKDVTGKVPGWIETFLYHSDRDQRDKHFMVCTSEASLLYAASLGCIEMNPWSSRTSSPDNPTWCIIDLDPDKNTFDQVITAAQMVKQLLDDAGIPSYPKTSGSTGLHIYIPLGGRYTYDQSQMLARLITGIIHTRIPEFTSIERLTAKRDGKMYLDFLQNRPQATIAAPYSIRPKPGATVSTPLHWDEVKKGLSIAGFTIHNVIDRLKQEGDLFKGVLGKGIDLQKALKKMEALKNI